MADVSQIKLPNGSVYDLIDEKSGYITAEYIENKTDYEIPVSRVGEIVVGETAIGTDSTNFPTSKAVVDYVDERIVQEMDAIDVGVMSVNGKTGSVTLSASDVGAITQVELVDKFTNFNNYIQRQIPTSTSQLTNNSGFITASDVVDEKVRSYDMSAQTNAHYDLMLSQNSESASTKYRDHGYLYYDRDSTTARLTIGAGSRSGIIRLINSTGVSTDLISSATSVTKTITLPNTNGTIALTSDIRPAFFSGSSPTSASLTEKIVDCKSFTSSDLKSGAAILVNFAYTNTAQASSVQLNVNQTGAKNIKFINNGTRGNLPSNPVLKSGAPLLFIYDGSYWVAYFNYDTTYSKMSESVMQNGTSSSEYLISADILKQAIIYHAPVQSVNGQTGAISLTIPSKTSDLTNDSGYLTASDIASVMTYKGTKANYAALPSTGNTTGDVWHLTDTGAEWAWDGSAWQELGTAIDLSGYATKATTLAGYGITDAKIQNGTITLGSNTITPLTSFTETDPVFSASAAAGITSTDISNWNGKSSTDEKVKATALTFNDSTHYPIFGNSSGNAETKNYTNAFTIGASSTYNHLTLQLGNANTLGRLQLYRGGGDSNRWTVIAANLATGNRTITLPDKTGTVALTSDIPEVYSSTNTGGYLTMATLPIYDGTVV